MEIDCVAWQAEGGKAQRLQWIHDYLETGRQGYRDHYCHLWPGGNPNPYLTRNFTREILLQELGGPGLIHWIVYVDDRPAGICKLDLERKSGTFHPGRALFLEKIYFRKEFTGKGLGSRVLQEIFALARREARTGVWLEAMQKGPALAFYEKHGFKILGPTAVPYPEVLEAEKHMWVLGKDL